MIWSELGEWWVSEVADDPAHETAVAPMSLDILDPESNRLYLDLGSGEGLIMKVVRDGPAVHGLDSILSWRDVRRTGGR